MGIPKCIFKQVPIQIIFFVVTPYIFATETKIFIL